MFLLTIKKPQFSFSMMPIIPLPSPKSHFQISSNPNQNQISHCSNSRDTFSLGPVSPFDAAAVFLSIGMAVILSSWSENYGDHSESKDLLTQFKGAAVAIASDEKIALLGAIQSLFEGSMYTFVFLWTPALSPNDEDIPHGFIFATFMLASMLGSSIASRLLSRNTLRVESYMQIVFVVSSVTLMLPVLTTFLVTPSNTKRGGITFAGCLQLLGFCAFEACVGIFWPSIMKMKSMYVPGIRHIHYIW